MWCDTCALTFLHGPGDGSTQGHVAHVRGPFVGHLTLLSFFLWPKGEVHGVDHKHPVQGLQCWKTKIIKRAGKKKSLHPESPAKTLQMWSDDQVKRKASLLLYQK